MLKMLTAIAVSCSVLLGCSSVQKEGDQAAVRTVQCVASNTAENTCRRNQQGKLVCHAWVFSTPSGPVVYPYKVIVGVPGEKHRIVWHLLEPGAKFKREDGPRELKSNGHFEEGFPANDDDGDNDSGDNGKKYRFTYKNNQHSPSGGHKYTIFFRNSANQLMSCDPNIENEAG